MTDDLISRADAIDALEKAKERYFDRAVVIARMQDILRAIPSAQPKQGEWEEKEVLEDTVINEWQSARCSECGKYHTTPYMYYFDNFNFCPNCGARMTERSSE